MLSVLQVPASRSSLAYVCLACRSKYPFPRQQSRHLSVEASSSTPDSALLPSLPTKKPSKKAKSQKSVLIKDDPKADGSHNGGIQPESAAPEKSGRQKKAQMKAPHGKSIPVPRQTGIDRQRGPLKTLETEASVIGDKKVKVKRMEAVLQQHHRWISPKNEKKVAKKAVKETNPEKEALNESPPIDFFCETLGEGEPRIRKYVSTASVYLDVLLRSRGLARSDIKYLYRPEAGYSPRVIIGMNTIDPEEYYPTRLEAKVAIIEKATKYVENLLKIGKIKRREKIQKEVELKSNDEDLDSRQAARRLYVRSHETSPLAPPVLRRLKFSRSLIRRLTPLVVRRLKSSRRLIRLIHRRPIRGASRKLNLRRAPLQSPPAEGKGKTLKEALLSARKSTNGRIVTGRRTFVPGKFEDNENVKSINTTTLDFCTLDIPQHPVPNLAYGLDRVLFNPGVYRLQDPRSRVYNFDPALEKIIPSNEFDFAALRPYLIASEDSELSNIALDNGFKFYSSTSNITSILGHFHFLISDWRKVNLAMLSKQFEVEPSTEGKFTPFQKAPQAIFLKPTGNGSYAIDTDKSMDSGNALSLVGKALEQLFVLPKEEFERFRKDPATGKSNAIPDTKREAFRYTGVGNVLVRSQLDAYDSRLPGNGIFDIKTRAVLPVRMDQQGRLDYARDYEIREALGGFESFEREYYDMIRSTMLKYSLQVRLGRMDGIFVAYHNIARIFGFQYLSVEDMDIALHGTRDRALGDQELKASLTILQEALEKIIQRFPNQPVRVHFETRERKVPFMHIFAEPITEEEMERLQNIGRTKVAEHEKRELQSLPISMGREMDEITAVQSAGDESLLTKDSVDEESVEDESQIVDDNANEENVQDSATAVLTAQADIAAKPKTIAEAKTTDVDANSDPQAYLTTLQAVAIDLLANATTLKNTVADIRSLPAGASRVTQIKDMGVQFQNILLETQQMEKGILSLEHAVIASEDENFTRYYDKLVQVLDRQKTENRLIHLTAIADLIPDFEPLTTVKPSEEAAKEADDEPNREMLALTLSTRSKINDLPCHGPPVFPTPSIDSRYKKETKWEIEYFLSEIPDQSLAWELYTACQKRRSEAGLGVKNEERLDQFYNTQFMRDIKGATERGYKWRKTRDELDRKIEVVVFEEGKGKDVADADADAVEGEETGHSVDGYMSWLYRKPGKEL